MPNTGFLLCGTGAAVDYGPNANWTSASTITTDNGSYQATVSISNHTLSDGLCGKNFGVSIPSGSIIKGIEAQIDRNFDLVGSALNVYLTKNGTDLGNQGKNVVEGTGNYTVGGATDLWGETWTEAQVESSNFGVIILAGSDVGAETFTIDDIQVQVTYQLIPSVDATLSG